MSVRTEGLRDLDEHRGRAGPTGLAEIDRVTGGGRAGEVWLVTGPDGAGRTTLALGFAREAAIRQGLAVRWLSTRHEPEHLFQQTVAAEMGYLGLLDPSTLTDDQRAALVGRRKAVADSPLAFEQVTQGGTWLSLVAEGGDPAMVVVEDSTDFAPESLTALKAEAERRGFWLVVVVGGHGLDRHAAQKALSQGADLALLLNRPDLNNPSTDRIGEADVTVLRPGRRAVVVTVAHQPKYGRFVNVAPAVV